VVVASVKAPSRRPLRGSMRSTTRLGTRPRCCACPASDFLRQLKLASGQSWRSPTSRPPVKPVEEKVRIVLAVLRGEVSMTEAARRERVSETSIAAWRDQFLDGGRAALAGGACHGPSTRAQELQAQGDEL